MTWKWSLVAGALAGIVVCTGPARSQSGDTQSGAPLIKAAILPGLIVELTRQLTPISAEIPDSRPSVPVTIAAVSYCGSDSRGGADALAVIVPEDFGGGTMPLSASDCGAGLPGLATRLARAQSTSWLEVAKLHATWRPWLLDFGVDDTASVGKGAPRLQPSAMLGRIPTSGLNLLPPPGQNYRFDLALGFTGSTIVAAIFRAGTAANPAAYLSSGAMTDSIPAGANLLAQARYSFINQMLRLYHPSYQLPIAIQGGGAATIDQIAASGGSDSLTITGRLSYAAMNYHGAMACRGSDLRIDQINLQPSAVNCGGTDMISQLRCQGQQAALTASSSALAAGLTNYYQGQQFHYSTAGHPLRFDFAGREFTAEFAALRSSSTASDLTEAGRATLRQVGP